MKNNETPEVLLDRIYHSTKVRKLVIILLLACIIICIIPLLPPVQNALFSFVDSRISRKGTSSGVFENRLRSLLSLPFFGLVVFVMALCCLFYKTVSKFLEDAKNTRLIIALAVGICVFLLVYVSIFSYRHGWQWLSNDNSSEMVLGKLLADENTFVSRNWHYSTEIRVIYQTIFIMPLFKLLGRYENWALIRALTILLNNLALIFSYLFMAKQMKIRAKWIFITCVFLIAPVSTVYWNIVTFGGYYILFIVQFFCCLGLFIRLSSQMGTTKTALIDFILFTALSFMLGIQGIRSLLCVHIPLLITCIYLYFKAAQKKNFPLFLACYSFVVCCAGFAANYLLHFWYSFHSHENMRLTDLYVDFFPKLGQCFVCFAGFFGLFPGSSLLSAQGIFSVIAIIATFLLFWAVIKSCRQKVQNNAMLQSAEYQFTPYFFIVSAIFNIFIFILVDEDVTDRFFIPFMVLYIPLIAIFFEHAEKFYGYLKRAAVILGIILFICGQCYLNLQNMAGRDINSVRKGYIKYLLDNQLDYGFATSLNANVTTELTNGKVELASLKPDGLNPDKSTQLQLSSWLISVKFFNPSFHHGESFLLLSRAEWDMAQKAGRPFTLLDTNYEDNNFIVIRYPSAEIIHREVLDN
ncbi:hypothetical protein R84B8_02262 [Treponema sp. R8-4-B8]